MKPAPGWGTLAAVQIGGDKVSTRVAKPQVHAEAQHTSQIQLQTT